MKHRAPLVLGATVAGLAGVLAFHSHDPGSGSEHLAGAASAASSSSSPTSSTSSTSSVPTSSVPPSTSSSLPASAGSPSSSRTATGADEQFQYGNIEVSVTALGEQITDVSTVELSEDDPRSQQIDNEAIPLLRSQVLAANSAKIDGVSGASYTSQAYAASVQSALDKLGLS